MSAHVWGVSGALKACCGLVDLWATLTRDARSRSKGLALSDEIVVERRTKVSLRGAQRLSWHIQPLGVIPRRIPGVSVGVPHAQSVAPRGLL